jgi:phytoene dehydrogenase-like protein
MYQSVARVKHGGQAFIDAFKKQFETLDVTIRTNAYITSCADVKERRAGAFILSNGERVEADSCIFTIHPRLIKDVLPQEVLTPAFKERVDELEPSVGFFSLYAVCDGADAELFTPGVISIFPDSDINAAFENSAEIDRPLVVIKSREEIKGVMRNVINAFELELPGDVSRWSDTTRKNRPADYHSYKARKQARIEDRIFAAMPFLKDHFETLDTSTMLTFKDYLNDPYGCAYGVKQKMGQLNLFGRVGLKNVFAAGQSAVLPGVMGTMMASFLVCKLLLEKDSYEAFIKTRLGR